MACGAMGPPVRCSRGAVSRLPGHCRDLTAPQLEGFVAEACWRHEHRRVRRLLAAGKRPDVWYNRLFFQSLGRPRTVTVTVRVRGGRKRRQEFSNADDPRIDPLMKLILPKVERCNAMLARGGCRLRGACGLARDLRRHLKDVDLRFRWASAYPLVELKWGSKRHLSSAPAVNFQGRQSALAPLAQVARFGGVWLGPHPLSGSTSTPVVGGLRMCRSSWELLLYNAETEQLLDGGEFRGRFPLAATGASSSSDGDSSDSSSSDSSEQDDPSDSSSPDSSDSSEESDASSCVDLGEDGEFRDEDGDDDWRFPLA